MPATSTIPLDDLPGALEHADALFAFSVHGLGGSKIAANKSLRGMMASEVAPQQQQQQKEAPKKGWLSSLNTAVVGERQEVVTLMLTLSASEETSTTPAAGGGGMPGMPAPPALARRSSGDRPLSGVPARSAMLLAGGRPNTPTVFYQSEHRTFGQQPVSPAVVSRSTSPLGFPDGGGEGGMGGGKQRPMTMSEEGIVHFSIPARVPGNRGSGTNGGGDGEGVEETMVLFVVELWQVVNRSRRALWGSLTLTWDNLMAVPVSPRKCGVFSGLQSERYPSAFLAVRRVCPPLPRPLSMSPRGVSNPVVEKFNPMVTFFTAIRRVTDGVSAEEDADWLGGTSGFGAGGSGSGDSGGGGGGGGGGAGSSLTASAEEWELVVCQELAVEGKYTFKIPLQFLFPVHNSLKHASLAWRARARKERHRQGIFSADEEAFAHGMVVVHVSVSRARGLGPIAAAAAAAAATAGAPQSTQLLAGGADAGGGATSNNQGQSSLARQASVGAGGREGLPAAGGGRGGLGGLGIEGAKVSSSMRAFGGRMKGMGVKAVAMARIASQASPAAHLRLGAVSSEEKILRQANFFVKVVYGPPSLSANSTSDDDSLTGVDGSSGLAGPGEAERVVGVTNTEYGSVEPVWGTNANLNACPYNAPRAKHQVSGATRLDVVSDIAADLGGAGGSSTTVGTQGEASSGASSTPSSLAFTFYVPAKHLEAVDGGGGSLRLHLCQNMFSLKAGIVDAPVGYVTIPLCGDAAFTVHSPEWRDVEAYNDLSVGGGSPSGGVSGDLLSEGEPRQDPPQVLVGVSIQARNSSSARSGSPGQRPLAFSDASWTLGDGPAAYGSMLGDLTGGTKTGGGGGSTAAGSAAAASAMARRISLGSGEWTKVVEDSDSDEDVADEGTAAAAAAAASTTSMQHLPGLSENLLSKAVSVRDCYGWMDLIGGPSRVLDTAALVDLFALVHYPLTWVESHAKGISDQVDRLARVLEVYTQRVSEGGNFRSSLLKKEPLLQYVATNLHIQVWSIRDPATGKDRSFDFVTTGAPTAHALGHVGGGLVTLQEKLQALGMKVLELQGSRKECKERGGVQAVTELEGITDNLRTALLEYEVLGGKVSIRRACVVSQAISIAATSFCAKLEMMARGTLDVASDRTTGGCGSYDELAERWVSTGFLLGFEGLLSIHGKEHGMVEDTVSALDMLADYNLKVVPATLVGTDTPPLGIGNPSPVADDPFELEIGVEGNTIQCIVGDACLPRLPRALWDSSSSTSSTDGRGGGGRAVRIVPVLFTQGIDIQQSMTHAARDAREKAAFQADINSQNLARLNRYCHRVCPVKAPTVTATPGLAGSSAAGGGVAASSPGSIPPLLSGGMPPLPRPRGSVGGLDDLLGLGEIKISDGGRAVREGEGGGGPGASVAGAMGQQQTSVGASVPEWMHPALSELETAVRDDKVAHKNTAILLEAQVAVRRLCGGRVTFCKSGKDRTAMSITLEEALLLAETTSQQSPPRDSEFGVEGPAGAVAAAVAVSGGWRAAERSGALADANVLRAYGARLLVAEKNIGRPLYSFNALQRQFIPELYQPPPQTIQDVITSALNRDS